MMTAAMEAWAQRSRASRRKRELEEKVQQATKEVASFLSEGALVPSAIDALRASCRASAVTAARRRAGLCAATALLCAGQRDSTQTRASGLPPPVKAALIASIAPFNRSL